MLRYGRILVVQNPEFSMLSNLVGSSKRASGSVPRQPFFHKDYSPYLPWCYLLSLPEPFTTSRILESRISHEGTALLLSPRMASAYVCSRVSPPVLSKSLSSE